MLTPRSCLAVTLALVCIWLTGCASAPTTPPATAQKYEFRRVLMGVQTQIVLHASADAPESARDAAALAFAEIARLEQVMSDYRPTSDLSRVNATAGSGDWVVVDASLVEILTIARDISVRTSGTFDATVGPAVALWRQSRRDAALPTPEARERAVALIDWNRAEFANDPPRVRLTTAGMKLDLGGIAKGYAAQRARDVLMTQGYKANLVAVAGDIALGDPPPGAQGWRVAIESAHSPLGTILVSNACVSTSGDSNQFIEIDGVRYAHIVDPRTGLGLTNGAGTPVTVIADQGSIADAMATAAFVLGPDAIASLDIPPKCTLLFHATPAPIMVGPKSAAQVGWTPASSSQPTQTSSD